MAGVVALVAFSATGCGAVEVAKTDASVADRAACADLVATVPGVVADEPRRETSGNPLGAAWGDPAIVLRCGVGEPADYDPFAGCQRVNGVDWFVPTEQIEDQDLDAVLTTIGRTPAVELVVPADLRPPLTALVDLAAAVKKHTRVVDRCR